MSLSDADVIQENSGSVASNTSLPVSLPSGTTAGNTVLVILYQTAGTLTPPSGFSLDAGGGANAIGVYRKSEVSASETSWTFTSGTNTDIAWYAVELSNVDLVEPLDVTANSSNGTLANGGTLSTGTTAQNAGLSVIEFAAFGALRNSGATVGWSGYTNGFTETVDVSGATWSLAVATNFNNGTTSTFSSTATAAVSTGTLTAVSRIVAYRAADAPMAAPLKTFAGFEWGTHGGMGNSTISNPQNAAVGASTTFGTQYLVQAGSARNGSYGFRLSTSASNAGMRIGSITRGGAAVGFNCRVVSATGTVVVAVLDVNTGSDLHVVYDATNTKFGLRWGASGTPTWQSGTTATNTWVWIDVRLKVNTTTFHAEWRLETGTDTYTDQTAIDLAGATGTIMSTMWLGNDSFVVAATQTMTADYDDIVISDYYAAYPLGPHKVQVLTVDTGGTPSVSGTTTNFSVFTSNGTLAAWNATNARNAVDEVPPTVSAASDGVVQTAVAASDYMEFPMANPTVAADEVIAAVRWVGAMWGGTGTGTGTLGIKVSDGTTETVVDAGTTAYDGDSLTAISANYPIWRQALIPAPSGGWTTSKANALVSRIGYSSDATPDMGVSAFYCEVAIRKAIDTVVHRLEDNLARTTLRVNPYSSAAVSYVTKNDDTNSRACMFRYWIGGVEQDPPVGAGGSRANVAAGGSQTIDVHMDAFGDIDRTSLEWV